MDGAFAIPVAPVWQQRRISQTNLNFESHRFKNAIDLLTPQA
jgi:hypothetical protein